MPFQDANETFSLGKDNRFQVGISNVDPRGAPLVEAGSKLFFEKANWLYYDVTLDCHLDSGMVIHQHLPQVNFAADTLANCTITDPDVSSRIGGVNLLSNDKYADVSQRMAHSRYWFRLRGQAMRAGEQIPIPGLKKIAGRTAIPHDENPQWAYNKIIGNYSGVALWYAQWSLWYMLAEQPIAQQTPPPNLGQYITGDTPLPDGMQAPWSQPDELAQDNDPRRRR